MNWAYKVTVIIPVYNVERYLEDSLKSLLAQTIPQAEMEVLMINDGSEDGSLEICERFAAAHENFKVISQENQGVSAARNAGIRNAKGKYLLYLDGDDTLSSETVKNVTDFFDEHYDEVDVVTYPLIYRRENGESSHWRYRYLKDSGVYDLDEYPYISQTTMNICVKNRGKDNAYFDTKLIIHEDIVYNLAQCMPLNRLGFCGEAKYIYDQRATGTARNIAHPYYEGENLLSIYEGFLNPYAEKKYAQAMVVYDISWRIVEDQLYPYHYSNEKLNHYKERLGHLLNRIDAEIILHHPQLNAAHKYFLLSLKTENRPSFQIKRDHKAAKDKILLLDQEGLLFDSANILMVLEQCKIEGDSLSLLAYLKNYAFDFIEKPRLSAVMDDETYVEIPLFLSQQSCFWSQMRTNTFWGFSFECDLKSFSALRFVVDIQGREFKTNYWLGDRQGIQPKINRSYVEGTNHAVMFENSRFCVVPRESDEIRRAKTDYERFLLKKQTKQWLVRRYARKRSGCEIWLYEDTYNAVDNAYYQFQHDFEKKDGIKRYYICDKQSLDWQDKFTLEQQKYLVQRKGRKHKKLFVQADKILVSFIGHNDFVPFDKNTILYYWDLFQFEVIYLQHGVMHAELSYMYSKEKIYMVDRIVASARFEQENLINKLAFREKDIICCGMPRLDRLTSCEKKKKILFAPSWRSYLVTSDAEGKRQAQSNFETSDYFQEVKKFLTDPRLGDLLEKHGYMLEMKLHPNFSVYLEAFETLCGRNVALVTEVELGEYMACVTDFTSFMYDFFYLDIPVFVHIFDYDRFKAGLHTYRELCWPMEQKYPYYCENSEDLFQCLARLMKSPEDVNEKLKQFTSGMFFSRERNHAERLYECLTGKDGNKQAGRAPEMIATS